MRYIKVIHNLLFPTKNLCYACKQEYDHIEKFLCNNCQEFLEILNRELEISSPYINKVYYSLIYNRFMREIIKDFKFNGKSYLYKPLGELMIGTIRERGLYDMDIILYIPSHRRKEAIRGYNQSELLARYISKDLDIPISHNNLIKIRHTKDQSSLDRYNRQDNLKDAFKLKNKDEILNKKILLVDDILTTGSTMMECSEILIKNKAREVVGLALTSSKKL